MNRDLIENRLKVIIEKALSHNFASMEELMNCSLRDDYGMDSILFMEILISIEDEFNINISDEYLMIENFEKISNIVSIIEKTMNKDCGE